MALPTVTLLSVAALITCVARARPGSAPGAVAPAPAAAGSPFVVAIEGPCPKLAVVRAGNRTVVVFGTQGLEDLSGAARQSLAVVERGSVHHAPSLLAGLERDARGYVQGDLDLGGERGAWLEHTARWPARASGGALFEARRIDYAWHDAAWVVATEREGLAPVPTLSTFCVDPRARALSIHAAARAADGSTWLAGRCEDELHRALGGLSVAVYRGGRATSYFTHYQGGVATAVEAPFDGPVVSAALRHARAAAWRGASPRRTRHRGRDLGPWRGTGHRGELGLAQPHPLHERRRGQAAVLRPLEAGGPRARWPARDAAQSGAHGAPLRGTRVTRPNAALTSVRERTWSPMSATAVPTTVGRDAIA